MSEKVKARIWFGATAVFAVAGFVWTFVTEPVWWKFLASIAVTVLTALLGSVFVPPKPPVNP